MKIKISDIQIKPEISIRQRMDEETIKRYMDCFEDLPPIVVFNTGEGNVLADGFHRETAAEHLGLLEIEAELRSGKYEDALEYAVVANAKHGRQLSGSETAEGIRRIYRLHPDWSQEKIGKPVGCSQFRVWQVLKANEVRQVVSPSSLSDEKLSEISKAGDKAYWASLVETAERKGYTISEIKEVVREVKDEKTSPKQREQLLKGEIKPSTKKGDEPAYLKETVEREIKEGLVKDKEVVFSRALEKLIRLSDFTAKEIVDELDDFSCRKAVEDLPRHIDQLNQIVELAKEKLEIREV